LHDQPQEVRTVVQATAAVLMWRNQAMKKAVIAWLEYVDTTRAQRELAEAALLRLMHSLEAATFAAWCNHARRKAQRRASLQRDLHAMQQQASLRANPVWSESFAWLVVELSVEPHVIHLHELANAGDVESAAQLDRVHCGTARHAATSDSSAAVLE
jgi:hypothetical protein